MAKGFTITTKIQGQKEFEQVLNEYKKWNRRQPAEIVAAKLYFVAANATNTTKTADKATIAQKLNEEAREYPDVPLAAILVNKQLKAKGKKGLTGEKMANAVQKFINKQISRVQFLRSGWLPALKSLDFFNKRGDISFTKRFAPKKPSGVKQYGKDKGQAIIPRRDAPRVWGRISNFIGRGKQDSPTVTPILQSGLNKAIAMEIRSMKLYITRKYQEQIDRVNKKKTVR
jgi:hypothetical protein